MKDLVFIELGEQKARRDIGRGRGAVVDMGLSMKNKHSKLPLMVKFRE